MDVDFHTSFNFSLGVHLIAMSFICRKCQLSTPLLDSDVTLIDTLALSFELSILHINFYADCVDVCHRQPNNHCLSEFQKCATNLFIWKF